MNAAPLCLVGANVLAIAASPFRKGCSLIGSGWAKHTYGSAREVQPGRPLGSGMQGKLAVRSDRSAVLLDGVLGVRRLLFDILCGGRALVLDRFDGYCCALLDRVDRLLGRLFEVVGDFLGGVGNDG